jgi:2-C-methyl-D-erythritol 4-phosphate cytidylyltransferase
MLKQPIDAVIVAAGSGRRLGSEIPKAFVLLAGKPLFMHSCAQFDTHASIKSIVLVVPEEKINEAIDIVSTGNLAKKARVVPGGKERWQSVQSGVNACASEWVLVHDAARPFVNHTVIDSVVEKMTGFDAVITVTPEVDTMRLFKDDRALETVDRNTLVRVGTPQLFRMALLKKAFLAAERMVPPPTDEAILMEAMGIPVGIAWGDPLNFKITTPSDLILAEALCAWDERSEAPHHK